MAHNCLKVTCVVTSDKKFVAVEPPSLDEQGSKLVIQLAVDCVFMVLNIHCFQASTLGILILSYTPLGSRSGSTCANRREGKTSILQHARVQYVLQSHHAEKERKLLPRKGSQMSYIYVYYGHTPSVRNQSSKHNYRTKRWGFYKGDFIFLASPVLQRNVTTQSYLN